MLCPYHGNLGNSRDLTTDDHDQRWLTLDSGDRLMIVVAELQSETTFMPYNPDRHHRRSIRLRNYDYTRSGLYFVTICVRGRECLLGSIKSGAVQLSEMGQIAARCWQAMPEHFPQVELDAFVVMPNHTHGVVHIIDNPSLEYATDIASTIAKFRWPIPGSLATIIRSYKAAVTKSINELHDIPGAPFWQRNYYEHIIRDQQSLYRIREYIEHNPLRWEVDPMYSIDASNS